MHEHVSLGKHDIDLVIAGGNIYPEHHLAGLVDELRPASQEGHRGTVSQEAKLPRQSIGQTDVISVHTCDVGSLHEVAGSVDGHGHSGVSLVDNLHVSGSSRVLLQDLRASVGRPVVHDDHLEIPHRLRHEAIERSGQEPLTVED